MIRSIVTVTLLGFVIGAAFMSLANRRVPAPTARARWLKLIVFFLIVHVVLGVAILGRPWAAFLMLAILVAGSVELWHAWLRMPSPRASQVWLVFVTVAAVTLVVSWLLPATTFAFLFLVTAACDGFSQVVGQIVGRHALAPKTSPAKTVEGLIGGLFAGVVVALLVRGLLVDTAPVRTAILALLVGLAGLIGDLAASWVKRRAGIKDYSAALPGQGGFLDRFDSLLGALTIVGPLLALVGA